LDSLGFEWSGHSAAWEDRLSELADYRNAHGHCNVPQTHNENARLGTWATTQRYQYSLHLKGKTSSMTLQRIQALESLGLEWVIRGAAWEDRLSELADYRKVHGHCNVPQRYSENARLGRWVATQRHDYTLHLKGKRSQITFPRIQAMESLGFEWGVCIDWEVRLSELVDYRKIHGHCNVPWKYSENTKLGSWVRFRQEGKTSSITLPRIQALESLAFEWSSRVDWEDRLSEVADYRKIHGHCNVPFRCCENFKLGIWVVTQRKQYSFHLKGKTSQITLPRIQALESLCFEWYRDATCIWEDRLSELANYRKVHGHCNVPKNCSQNAKLSRWVATQRHQYSLHLKRKTSAITLPRIQALESLGFEWKPRSAAGKGQRRNQTSTMT
jgi:hypothetical protein